jgi:hypothetical protein
MSVEERLAKLEKRVQAAEDELEILRLINTYGPAVDSGESLAAARLWIEGGAYSIGGGPRLTTPTALAALYDGDGHQALIHQGSAHMTATPKITVTGDTAEAVAYSFVVLKRKDENAWDFWRAAVNHWMLKRTPDGWRIIERFNRVLDGSKESHDILRKAVI